MGKCFDVQVSFLNHKLRAVNPLVCTHVISEKKESTFRTSHIFDKFLKTDATRESYRYIWYRFLEIHKSEESEILGLGEIILYNNFTYFTRIVL